MPAWGGVEWVEGKKSAHPVFDAAVLESVGLSADLLLTGGVSVYRDVLILWGAEKNAAVLALVDEVQQASKNELVAVHAENGVAFLFWREGRPANHFETGGIIEAGGAEWRVGGWMSLGITTRQAILRVKAKWREGFVYLLRGEGVFKIGKSINAPERARVLSTLLPFPVSVEHVHQTHDMDSLERALHEHFARKRVHGEWFRLDEDDVETFRNWMEE